MLHKKLFLLFFIVTPLFSFSQSYHPFPDSLGKWSIRGGGYQDCYYPSSSHCSSDWIYEEAGDTIIDTYRYIQIKSSGELIGGIREDSTKKVWFRKFIEIPIPSCPWQGIHYAFGEEKINTFPKDTDLLLYDFGISVGNWFCVPERNNYYQCFGKLTEIDSIKTLDGEFRRIYTLSDYYGFTISNWIEGIGSDLGLFGSYVGSLAECSNEYLKCFGIGGNLIWGSYYSCSSIFSTHDVEVYKSFSLSPQPASDYFIVTLKTNSSTSTLSISNLLGQPVYRKQLTEQSTLIQTNNIGEAGIYFCRLTDSNGNVYQKKLIIQ